MSKSPMTMFAKTGLGDVAARRRLEFAAGSGITLSLLDQPLTKSVKLSISATGGGGVSTGRAAMVTGTGLSLGSLYELHRPDQGGLFVRLTRRRTFPIARSVGLATPEHGWTWLNSGALDSADENTTTADAFVLDHDGTLTRWDNTGTHTGPYRYREYSRHYVTLDTVARLRATAAVNYQTMALQVVDLDAYNTFGLIGPAYFSGQVVRTYTGGSSTTNALTAPQWAAGIWVRIVVESGGDIHLLYSTSSSSTPPTSWTKSKTVPSHFATTTRIGVGVGVHTWAANDGLVGEVLYLDTAYQRFSGLDWLPTPFLWPATQFDTSGTAVQLLADYDIGSDAPAPDTTTIRKVLADAENQISGDAATWTWSMVRSATPGAGAGSFAAAAAMTPSGTGRYWNLWAKATSTGDAGGSLCIPRLVLPAA